MKRAKCPKWNDMTELKPQPAELVMTLEITRAETGNKETVTLVGSVDPDKLKEIQDGCNSLDSIS